MSKALIGILLVFCVLHLVLIAIPLADTLKAAISRKSKLVWCLFLALVPLIGVALFHFRFRSSHFRGEKYEISAAEERARSGTLAPDDRDR